MYIPSLILLISWATFIIYWLISSFWVKRDITGGDYWKWWWVRIIIIIGVVLIIKYAPHASSSLRIEARLFDQYQPQNIFLNYTGAILTALGIGLAIWARIHLGRNWSSHPALKENHELVTSGPYKLIRHPIYTGIILAALGSSFISSPAIIILIIVLIMFVARVKKEESLMQGQFPNTYPEYKKRTWALIPFVW